MYSRSDWSRNRDGHAGDEEEEEEGGEFEDAKVNVLRVSPI